MVRQVVQKTADLRKPERVEAFRAHQDPQLREVVSQICQVLHGRFGASEQYLLTMAQSLKIGIISGRLYTGAITEHKPALTPVSASVILAQRAACRPGRERHRIIRGRFRRGARTTCALRTSSWRSRSATPTAEVGSTTERRSRPNSPIATTLSLGHSATPPSRISSNRRCCSESHRAAWPNGKPTVP
jgi:hypothetical protein